MSIIPDGVYTITKPNNQVAGVIVASAPPDPNSLVFVLPLTPDDELKWIVTNVSDGNVTIQNLVTKRFLGYQGDPVRGRPCEQAEEAIEWRLQLTGEPGLLHVVVPGGPVGGTELAFDIALIPIFPPRTALDALRLADVRQAWGFVRQGE